MELTKAQGKVVQAVINAGSMDTAQARTAYDARAVNNLVKKGILIEKDGKLSASSDAAKMLEGKTAKDEKKTSKAKKEAAPKREKSSVPLLSKEHGVIIENKGKCLCGCDADTKARRLFVQGHDARLRKNVLLYVRGKGPRANFPKSEAVQSYLLNVAHWMTPEIKDVLNGKVEVKKAS